MVDKESLIQRLHRVQVEKTRERAKALMQQNTAARVVATSTPTSTPPSTKATPAKPPAVIPDAPSKAVTAAKFQEFIAETEAEEAIDQGVAEEEALNRPDDFRQLLGALDREMHSQLGITALSLGAIRSFVQKIMESLLLNPELIAILVDTDTHNIMRFIRHVHSTAIDSKSVQITKREKKAAGKKGGHTDIDFAPITVDELTSVGGFKFGKK